MKYKEKMQELNEWTKQLNADKASSTLHTSIELPSKQTKEKTWNCCEHAPVAIVTVVALSFYSAFIRGCARVLFLYYVFLRASLMIQLEI